MNDEVTTPEADEPVTIRLASVPLEELLLEIKRRDGIKVCIASALIDGRDLRKHEVEARAKMREANPEIDEAALDERAVDFTAKHIELLVLEMMARGIATAKPTDRVHEFVMQPASGDYAPGSVLAQVRLLAIPLIFPEIIDSEEVKHRAHLDG